MGKFSTEKIISAQYKGAQVTFDDTLANVIFVNATEMGSIYGEKPERWLELPSTKQFLNCLSLARMSVCDFVPYRLGRADIASEATSLWFNEDVAVEFARWLSPAFSIWCSDKIKEIASGSHYVFSIFSVPKTLSEALALAAEQAKAIEDSRFDARVPKKQKWETLDILSVSMLAIEAQEMADAYFALSVKSSDEEITNVIRLINKTRQDSNFFMEDIGTSDIIKQCDLFDAGIEKLKADIVKAKESEATPALSDTPAVGNYVPPEPR